MSVSRDSFVRMPARRLEGAECVWVNRAWAASALNLSDIATIRAWILEHFAYQIAPSGAQASKAWFDVDRYGCTGLKYYGGSGRAGVVNGLQVKGIGATPLVDPDADADHSHGLLSLREAILEAVYSVAASRAFPYGAVQSIAIIRAPRTVDDRFGAVRRAALMVRPFQVRPCHLQRAVGFTSEQPELAHLDDVRRVREYFGRYADNGGELSKFASVLGSQVAMAHLLSWFGGGFYSSNICLNGQLIDFAAATILPSWTRAPKDATGPMFGDEAAYAYRMLDSLSFYTRKYGRHQYRIDQLFRQFEAGYRNQLVLSISDVFAVDEARIRDNRERLYETFIDGFERAQEADSEGAREAERSSMLAISEILDVAAVPDRGWRMALGFGEIVREGLEQDIAQVSEGSAEQIQSMIDRTTSRFLYG